MRQADSHHTRPVLWPCIAFFLIGALLRIDIYIIGRFAAGEILAITLFPLAMRTLPELLRNPALRALMLLLLLWCVGVILSDIVNRSFFFLFLRGIARPLICICLLVVVYFLASKNPRSMLWFFFGLLVSGVLNALVPTDFRASDIEVQTLDNYKFVAFALTPLLLGVASVGAYLLYKVSPYFAGFFQIGLAVASVSFVSRTTAATLLVGGLLILAFKLIVPLRHVFILNGRLRKSAIIKAVVLTLVAFTALFYSYAYAAESGLLGERQQAKHAMQSSSVFGNTPWGVLMSGRHYTLGAILRIIDTPFFGAGSWPYAEDYLVRAFYLLGEYNIPDTQADPTKREIGHSILFGIWAQNGILVLPFLLLSFWYILRLITHIVATDTPYKALILIYLISFSFGFFFNNFNSFARLMLVFLPVFCDLYIKAGYLNVAHVRFRNGPARL